VIIGSATLGASGGLGLWALLADARLVPGRSVVDTMLGRCDIVSNPPEAEPGKVLKSSFYSTHRKRTVRYQVAYPPNPPAGGRLPICIYLHAYGGDEKEAVESFGFHRLLAGAVAAGVPPFIIATVDGGDRYWHPRADGDNPLAMVLEDFPTALAQHGLATDKLAVMGISMGGYGALLAASEAPKRFLAAVASSPAYWDSFGESQDANQTAFDSEDDWRAYGDLRKRAGALKDIPVRIDCGDADPFEPNLRGLQKALPSTTTLAFAPGCHDGPFWRQAAPEQLRLIGSTLTPPCYESTCPA
jgi:S-formylglutathione hydrolase FrmB